MKIKHLAIWILLALSALGLAELALYARKAPNPKVDDPIVRPETAPIVAPAPPPKVHKEPLTVKNYVPKMGANGISFTAEEVTVAEGQDPKLAAVEAFLKGSQIAPAGARALGVDVEDGVAHIGFNAAFDHTYGSFDEKSMLDGLSAVLGQFPDVKTYVMEIEGKPLKTLGEADLSDPIPVTKPENVPLDKPATDAPTDTSPTDKPATP